VNFSPKLYVLIFQLEAKEAHFSRLATICVATLLMGSPERSFNSKNPFLEDLVSNSNPVFESLKMSRVVLRPQRGAGAESSRGVGFGPPVCLVGRSGTGPGEFTGPRTTASRFENDDSSSSSFDPGAKIVHINLIL